MKKPFQLFAHTSFYLFTTLITLLTLLAIDSRIDDYRQLAKFQTSSLMEWHQISVNPADTYQMSLVHTKRPSFKTENNQSVKYQSGYYNLYKNGELILEKQHYVLVNFTSPVPLKGNEKFSIQNPQFIQTYQKTQQSRETTRLLKSADIIFTDKNAQHIDFSHDLPPHDVTAAQKQTILKQGKSKLNKSLLWYIGSTLLVTYLFFILYKQGITILQRLSAEMSIHLSQKWLTICFSILLILQILYLFYAIYMYLKL